MVELSRTPMYKNLGYRLKIFNFIEIEDLLICLGLAIAGGMVGNFIDRKLFGFLEMNIFLQYIVPVIMLPCLVLFKYGKPRSYFADRLMFLIHPRVYSPGGRDEENATPYLTTEAS